MNANINIFDTVKQQLFPSFHQILTKKYFQDVQLEMLQHHFKYHLDLKCEKTKKIGFACGDCGTKM